MFLDDPPIYTSFIHRFCSLFVKFYRKPCKLHGDKLTCSWCLVIKFNNRLRDVTSVEHYVGQSADLFIYGVTHVNHCLSSTGPKKGHQRQLLASRYFNCQINYMPLFFHKSSQILTASLKKRLLSISLLVTMML